MRHWVLLIVLGLPFGMASAQTFGEITGEVHDQSGAAAPNAVVTVTNTATSASRSTTTNDAGIYNFPSLVPGAYQVRVELQGFQPVLRTGIELEVQQTARVDFTLKVGQATQAIEVAGAGVLLATENATVGTVIGQKSIEDLPLNGRNYLQLVALSPNVTYGFMAPNNEQRRQGGTRTDQNISVAGLRGVWNYYTLDGIANTDVNFNLYIQLPSVDALQEFKVQSGIYPAEFGREAGQINVSTKSGSNQYHGTAFEFLRNSDLDAKPFDFIGTAPHKAPFRWNQYGFTLGGPVSIPKLFAGKDRLFFMSNFEGFKSRRTDLGLYTTPPDSWRNGDFSSFGTQLYDPLSRRVGANGQVTATPFTNNHIDPTRFDPISLKLLEFWPSPNLNTPTVANNYQNPQKTTIDKNQFNQRIDFNESAKSQWFGRFSWTDESTVQPGLPLSGITLFTTSKQYMVSNTRVLSAAKVNEFRFGYTTLVNNSSQELANKRDVVKELGLPYSTGPASWGIPAITGLNLGLSSFGNDSNGPFLLNDKIAQVLDNFSWVRGKQALRFGGEYRWDVYNNYGNQFERAQFQFTGAYTANPIGLVGGNGAADFLLGNIARTDLALGPAVGDFKSNTIAFYVDDTYRVTPRLTLTIGMRWEAVQPWKDDLQNEVNYQFQTGLPSAVNVDPSLHPVLVRAGNGDFYQGLDFRYVGAQTARDGRLGDRLVASDWNLLAPRFGIAYSPSNQWSIRTGFGIFYSQESANSRFDLNRGTSGRASQTPNVGIAPTVTYANFFSRASLPVLIPPGLTWAVAPDIGTPYAMNYVFNVQRQLGANSTLEAGYNGLLDRHLQNQNNGAGLLPYNAAGVAPGITSPAARAPYPEFASGIELTEGGGRGSYNALGIKLTQRLRSGLTTLISYTWSKALDDGSAIRGTGIAGQNLGDMYPEDPRCRKCEKGPSAFNTPARLVASVLYDLPLGKGKSFVNRGGAVNQLIGGWQTSGIFTAQSGRPLYLMAGWDAAGQVIVGNQDRLNATGLDPYLPSNKQSADQWFNTGAFSNVTAGQFGNVGRNILTGPSVWTLDFSAIKNFPFTEKQRLQLRIESFNTLNHPALGSPITNWGGNSPRPAPNFGQIRDTVTGGTFFTPGTAYQMRQVQLALKYIF
ncbi:MAG TPA: carboxypeptidase-like regulatory domain-containing protein [Bryobacteraceae bacterium]|nr:carboxypeptidase-like regulatory domain-containing protein [Bryobacteraceae bacterium]